MRSGLACQINRTLSTNSIHETHPHHSRLRSRAASPTSTTGSATRSPGFPPACPVSLTGTSSSAPPEAPSLAADIHEDQDNYYARFELPGVKKEDVKIELSNNLLTVSAEKKEKRGDEESSYSLTRSISVPDTVKADAIGAKLEDGILTVTLPKTEERKPKTIAVA